MLAKSMGCLFFETSAQSGQNVEITFKELTKIVLFHIGDEKDKEEGWELDKSDEKEKQKCC